MRRSISGSPSGGSLNRGRSWLALAIGLEWLALVVGCGQQASQTARAPTVQTGVTQVATPAVPGGSPTLAGPIQIAQVTVNSTDAVVFLQNVGAGGSGSTASVDISGWKLEVGTTTVTIPAGTRVAPGTTLGVHAGPPVQTNPSTAGSAAAVATPPSEQSVDLGPDGASLRSALRPGAQVLLVNARGEIMSLGTAPTNGT
jgi:hypothetical protein